VANGAGPDPLRERLLRLLRQKSKRSIPRPPSRPVDIRFHEIRDPFLNVPLTAPAAWDLLIAELEADAPITTIRLDVPEGKEGHVVTFAVGNQLVYVKLEIGDGDRVIYLRSYHLSGPPT
jgi:hypothetical protein